MYRLLRIPLSVPSCVATAKSLSLSEPQLPCLRNGSFGESWQEHLPLASAHQCQTLTTSWAAEAVP